MLNSTVTLEDKVVDILNSKLYPRGFGSYRVSKVTGATVETDFPGGRENVSIDRLFLVPGVPESLPSLQSGRSRPFSERDEVVDVRTSRTRTVCNVEWDDNQPTTWP